MRVRLLGAALVALALVSAGQIAGHLLAGQQPAPPEATAPPAAPTLPENDVPGKDAPGLPRYPGSVRVEFERGKRDGLIRTRARYATPGGLGAVRGFYRGVFRSENWMVADVGFDRGEWTFYIVRGEREADIEILSRGPSVEVRVEFSEPRPRAGTERRTVPEPPGSAPDTRTRTRHRRASGARPLAAASGGGEG